MKVILDFNLSYSSLTVAVCLSNGLRQIHGIWNPKRGTVILRRNSTLNGNVHFKFVFLSQKQPALNTDHSVHCVLSYLDVDCCSLVVETLCHKKGATVTQIFVICCVESGVTNVRVKNVRPWHWSERARAGPHPSWSCVQVIFCAQ